MKNENSKRLTVEQQTELDALANLPDAQIDTTDIPEVRDWVDAERGVFYRARKSGKTVP